ncbi:MAG: hypothetical protein GWN58_65475 [Anaerolineae bacterium]|nr:hypothetical protein [Anaerolineae bacterium]
MNNEPVPSKGTPHLTPKSLVGRSKFEAGTFGGITVALVGFCPRSSALDAYHPQPTHRQYFIHVPPASVELCSHGGIEFLSLTHVYGGPVASALIEELAYYGFEYALAYGLAGGLDTEELKMGDFYLVERALALDGTTPHYTDDRLIPSDGYLNAKIEEFAEWNGLPNLKRVQAMTADAIYREYDEDLDHAREQRCDIVNCDSSHLFAVAREVGIKTTECGVISDVIGGDGEESESELAEMLPAGEERAGAPLALVGRIVEFYVETLIPEL